MVTLVLPWAMASRSFIVDLRSSWDPVGRQLQDILIDLDSQLLCYHLQSSQDLAEWNRGVLYVE